MVIKDLRKGIEYSLSNGKRLFDDATILYKAGRFNSCIVLDILAYEEFNKAKRMLLFLGSNRPFQLSDLEKLTDAHSHTQKVLDHAVSFGNMLKNDSAEKYNGRREFATQMGLPFPKLSREMTVASHDDTTRYFAQLHKLRKVLMYAGFDEKTNTWFGAERFDTDKLRAICGYLYHEVVIPYHETRLNLVLLDNRISADSRVRTPEQQAIINNNPDAIAGIKNNLMCQSEIFAANYQITRDVIDSL